MVGIENEQRHEEQAQCQDEDDMDMKDKHTQAGNEAGIEEAILE